MPPPKSTYILLGTWLAAFAWRPFLLGFYSDDYSIILEPLIQGYTTQQLFDFYTGYYANRPLSGLFRFGLALICGDNPHVLQFASAVLCLMTGILVWMVVTKLNEIGEPLSREHVAWIASIWFVLPTSFGFASWATYAAHLPAAVFFLVCFYVLLPSGPSQSSDRLSVWRGFAGLAAYALSLATFESFYLQYIMPFGILFFSGVGRAKSGRLVAWISLFTTVQFGAIAFNRLVSEGVRKRFDPEFLLIRVSSVLSHPEFLPQVLIPLAVVSGSMYFGVRLLRSQRRAGSLSVDHQMVLVFLASLIASTLVFFAAGYSIRPFGTGSRTTVCVSITVCFLLLPVCRILRGRRICRAATRWAMVIFLLALTAFQGNRWAASWHLQQQVLKALPVHSLMDLPARSIVLCIVPNFVGDVLVFEETWTMASAVNVRYPDLRNSELRFLPHKNTGFRSASAHYVGDRFSYEYHFAGHQEPAYIADNLYVWNYYTGELLVATDDISIPSGLKPLNLKVKNLELL